MSVKPYTISIPDQELEQLSQRLSFTRLPDQLDNEDAWEVGTPLADVQRLLKYWKEGFDWRKAEAELNEMPNFKTPVDVNDFGEIDIHFVHQLSPVKGAIPLLFIHGWPGSFLEVQKLLPLLQHTKNGSPAFHVVAPSLPNFGFSSGVTQKGFGIDQYGEALHKLMLKLGYNQYVTQGGDWGFSICRSIAIQYPQHNKASHLNMIHAYPPTPTTTSPLSYLQHLLTPYTDFERAGLDRTASIAEHGMAYNKFQSTKPQTIGFSLADSPIGLLSWIYEKFHAWSDAYPWTDDEILTWVCIYWFSTAGPAASVRIYYEATHPRPGAKATRESVRRWVPGVKLGLASFKGDIAVVPGSWQRTLGPVVLQSEYEEGGHFAAWEVPGAVVGDLTKMFRKGGPCYGILEGRDGY